MNPYIITTAKRFNFEYISSKLGSDEYSYKNGLREMGVIEPYDWQGLVLIGFKFEDLLNIWKKKKGVLLFHPWIINRHYTQLERLIKQGKDYRICSENKLKISFDIH